jgi:hypothetical protein
MTGTAGYLWAAVLAAASLLAVAPPAVGERRASALERYGKLKNPPVYENFAQGWQDRVALEFEIINEADLHSLRAGLGDGNPFVRAMSAHALGFRADRGSADTLARLALEDPENLVRIRAVEALGFLKMRPDVIERARQDPDPGVQWTAGSVAGMVGSGIDYAAQARRAFAEGLRRTDLASARLGRKAPYFTARTSDGKPFRLSQVVGRKPIALYFAAFDG